MCEREFFFYLSWRRVARCFVNCIWYASAAEKRKINETKFISIFEVSIQFFCIICFTLSVVFSLYSILNGYFVAHHGAQPTTPWFLFFCFVRRIIISWHTYILSPLPSSSLHSTATTRCLLYYWFISLWAFKKHLKNHQFISNEQQIIFLNI